jgi:hypothetical protein
MRPDGMNLRTLIVRVIPDSSRLHQNSGSAFVIRGGSIAGGDARRGALFRTGNFNRKLINLAGYHGWWICSSAVLVLFFSLLMIYSWKKANATDCHGFES